MQPGRRQITIPAGKGNAMNQMYRLAAIWALAGALTAAGADKKPVPPKSDQEPVRARLKVTFKAEYARADPLGAVVLAYKLAERAAEENESTVTRYVMLTEAMALATKGGEIEVAMRAAGQ